MLKLALARIWSRMSAIHPIGISSTYHASELGEKFVYTTGILVLLLTLELHAILTRYFQLP
jgi:hypothetical protein